MGDASASFTFGGGASFGYYFNQHVGQNSGLGLDILYCGLKQKYSGTLSGVLNQTFLSEVDQKCIEFPIYYRFGTQSGAYFELGLQMALLLTSDYVNTNIEGLSTPPGGSMNSKPYSSTFYIGPLIGFGIDIPVTEDLIITTGLRFTYAINDAKGVDPFGFDLNNQIKGSSNANPLFPTYDNYKKTHPGVAAVLLGVHYRFDVGAYGHVK